MTLRASLHVTDRLARVTEARRLNAPTNGAADALPTEAVRPDPASITGASVHPAADVSEDNRYHHDSKKLASTLLDLYDQRRDVPNVLPRPAEQREEVVVA